MCFKSANWDILVDMELLLAGKLAHLKIMLKKNTHLKQNVMP